jgi:hypothetical protein
MRNTCRKHSRSPLYCILSGFRKDLNEANEQVEELDEDKARIDQETAALEQQLQAYADVAERASAVEAELDGRRQQKQNQLILVNNSRSMVDDDLTGQHSLRELDKMLREYDDKGTSMDNSVNE